MKIKGFFKDVTGAFRVARKRKKLIKKSSNTLVYDDPIREVAEACHPEFLDLIVTSVVDVASSARKITFERLDGMKLPPFEAGQYVSLELKIGTSLTTRPYSVCSSPSEARSKSHPHISITVRDGLPGIGFASSYLYSSTKVGDTFRAHFPFGFFYFEPLRDANSVVALAGGSGITPFLSMAKEIKVGKLDCSLVILYGSKSSKDIILKDELLSCECDKVKVIPVISDEPDYCGEKGFLDASLILKYSPFPPSSGKVSYFVCGPSKMYEFVKGELEKLNVPSKRIRMESFAPKAIKEYADYPLGDELKHFKIKIHQGLNEFEIPCFSSESVLVALERAGIASPSRCRSGECGFCRLELISGQVYVPSQNDGRRYADKEYGYIHSCSSFPLSDLEIRIQIR